jgi:hypothetical protein
MTHHPLLQFDWEEAMGVPIGGVLCREQQAWDDNSLNWQAIAFVLGERAVILTVNDDTDEVVVSLKAASETMDWDDVSSLSYAVARTFGWCWVGSNYKGYDDTFTVAFGNVVPDALDPRWMFLAEASRLTCFELTAHRS